jgi:flagellin
MIFGARQSSLDLAAQAAVNNAFDRLAGVTMRISSLQRIRTASDDPAGVIAAEQLSRDLASLKRAAGGLDRTRAVVHVADTALAHAGSLLTDVQANVVAAASDTLSADQRDALQLEVDAALDSINRLGQTTFGGQKVFGESLQFVVGANPTDVETLELPAIDDSLGGTQGVLADLRSGGSAALNGGDLEAASAVLEDAQSQILSARAEAGSFERYAIDSTRRLMEDQEVSLARSLSAIQDADIAAESSHVVREMILADTAIATAKLTMRARRLVSTFTALG